MVETANLKEKLVNLKTGKLSCTQNVQDFLAEVEKNNEKYNIFLEINEKAFERAKELDEKLKSGKTPGKLFGLTFGLKSNISAEDMTIFCASKTLENYKGTFNAEVVQNILAEDGIILGILNNDEFASGVGGETSAFGPAINPKSPQRVPGGSSSGSGAALAANMCDVTLGSDTGGSIRNPASHCGVVGIKPSFGRVSRYGLVDLSMSLDQIGPLSPDVYTSALVMEVISGKSSRDGTTVEKEVENYSEAKPKENYKIGVIKEFNEMISDAQIKDLFNKKIETLKSLGHEIVEISSKTIELAVQSYYPIVYVEFFSGTRKLDSVKYGNKIEAAAGEEALRRLLGGREISKSEFDGSYYKKALKVKELISEELSEAFKQVDFIVAPVTPKLPNKFGEKLSTEDSYAFDAFTIPSNLAGICAGVVTKDSVKVDDEEIFIGLQVMADKFKEKTMFEGLFLLENL